MTAKLHMNLEYQNVKTRGGCPPYVELDGKVVVTSRQCVGVLYVHSDAPALARFLMYYP